MKNIGQAENNGTKEVDDIHSAAAANKDVIDGYIHNISIDMNSNRNKSNISCDRKKRLYFFHESVKYCTLFLFISSK